MRVVPRILDDIRPGIRRCVPGRFLFSENSFGTSTKGRSIRHGIFNRSQTERNT